MSKERSTPVDRRLTAAHERIEELERENYDYSHLAGSYLARAKRAEQERDQLREDVTLLRETVLSAKAMIAHPDNIAILDKALAATEQNP